jgi:hypothetical protein
MIPGKLYDILKWVALIVLPSLATLVKAICMIWNLPYGDAISLTITAVATFIGALLGVDTAVYNKKLKSAKKE